MYLNIPQGSRNTKSGEKPFVLLSHLSKLKFYLFIRLLQKVACSGYLHQRQII